MPNITKTYKHAGMKMNEMTKPAQEKQMTRKMPVQ